MDILKIVRIFLLLTFIFNTSGAISDDSTKPLQRLRNSGDITGKVTCTIPEPPIPVEPNSDPLSALTTPAEPPSPPVEPTSPPIDIPPPLVPHGIATVYIPGMSFVAKVKPEGNTFTLLNVPKGTYSIVFGLPNIFRNNPKIIEGVMVRKRQVTDLGTIDICEDHCYDNSNCESSEFCKLDGGSGRCETRPDVCPEIHAPVCGTDNKTYGNTCEANAAGVNIIHEGECPEICPPTIEPVCGIDGSVYHNECEAKAAGIEIGPEENCNQSCGGDVVCSFPDYCVPSPCPPGAGDCPGSCFTPGTGIP